MATSFQKTFSIVVTFTKNNPVAGTDKMPSSTITEDDIQSLELRAAIKEGIEKASRITKGVYNTQPGTVSEV